MWRRLADLRRQLRAYRDVLLPTEFGQLYRQVRPYSMCGHARLLGLYRAVRHVIAGNIPGDIVECGCARGGSALLLGATLQRLRSARALWVFDTFEGLPPPSGADPDHDLAAPFTGTCRGDLTDLETLFTEFGIRSSTQFVKGLFQETLPAAPVTAIAVLHIDADWYDSVAACLEHLYDRVSPGGVIQIDDYGHWAGARKAVDEFWQRRSVSAPLRFLDYTGCQAIKPGPAPCP